MQYEGQQFGTGENSLFEWYAQVIICKEIYILYIQYIFYYHQLFGNFIWIYYSLYNYL